MAKRRDNGDGSIRERPDGRFEGRIRIQGQRRSVYGATKGEVKKQLDTLKRQAETGTLVKPDRQTLGQYLEYWLSVHKLTTRGSTTVQYESHIRAQIAPALGDKLLQKLTRDDVQRFVTGMGQPVKVAGGTKEGLKPSSIKMTATILKKALDDAVEWGLLASNPCKGVRLPRVPRTERPCLSQDEAKRFVEALRGQWLETFVILALATAMRRGELLGLKWSDIDFEAGTLHLQRILVFINRVGYQETEAKTEGSHRTITLAGFALDALRTHRIRQAEQRLKVGPAWRARDLIFTNATGDYVRFPVLQEHFKKALIRAGLPEEMHPHTLRHSAATILLQMGVPAKVVQELLGHSTIRTTMDIYGHVMPGMHDAAIAQLHTVFSEEKKTANELF